MVGCKSDNRRKLVVVVWVIRQKSAFDTYSIFAIHILNFQHHFNWRVGILAIKVITSENVAKEVESSLYLYNC